MKTLSQSSPRYKGPYPFIPFEFDLARRLETALVRTRQTLAPRWNDPARQAFAPLQSVIEEVVTVLEACGKRNTGFSGPSRSRNVSYDEKGNRKA